MFPEKGLAEEAVRHRLVASAFVLGDYRERAPAHSTYRVRDEGTSRPQRRLHPRSPTSIRIRRPSPARHSSTTCVGQEPVRLPSIFSTIRMATVEVLNWPDNWPGRRSVYGFPATAFSRPTIGWGEGSGALFDKAILQAKLCLVAQTWVELCTRLKVRISKLLPLPFF